MSLNFTYLLYFKRQYLWDALQGVVEMAERHHPPTVIHFPDHDLPIPLKPASMKPNEYQHDDPVITLDTVLNFEEDAVILEYLADLWGEDLQRSPPGSGRRRQLPIGTITLEIFQEIPHQTSKDYVLFEFLTTGTRMSYLFADSPSIQAGFARLLEKCRGSSGILNEELDGSELFWLNGRRLSVKIPDMYMLPDELDEMLDRGWGGGDAWGKTRRA